MSTFWKLPSAFAELAVGSMVVLYHLSLARRLDQAALKRDEPRGHGERTGGGDEGSPTLPAN